MINIAYMKKIALNILIYRIFNKLRWCADGSPLSAEEALPTQNVHSLRLCGGTETIPI